MTQWYAGVNYGLERFAVDLLKLDGAKGIKLLDGAVLFSCDKEIKAPWAVNVFRILTTFHSADVLDAGRIVARNGWKPVRFGHGSFRVIIMDMGKLRPLPNNLMEAIERKVTSVTGLRPNRGKPDMEIWLNRRNDGSTFFMLRSGDRNTFGTKLNKGELRQDIAYIMLHAASGRNRGVVADPFGGWGAIAAAATIVGWSSRIYTGDINPALVRFQQKRFKNEKRCVVSCWDATALPLDNSMADAVVTDPPWGEFTDVNTRKLYSGFVGEAARILRPGGKLIFLSSARIDSEQALNLHRFDFNVTTTKINGKKTFLFCCSLENK